MVDTDLVRRLRMVSNQVWEWTVIWDWYAKSTIGRQWISSLDSVGANLVEGDARHSEAEALHHFSISRGSLREAEYWLGLATDRGLIAAEQSASLRSELQQLGRMLNGLIDYRRRYVAASRVRETPSPYHIEEQDCHRDVEAELATSDLGPQTSDLLHP